ncbi:MAG: PIN domain-containing protein [Bacillota bacterium]|nr:PIN domain-containing protein [Bacillota bacterium]
MRVLLDTNIVLDILQKREPFFADSYRAMRTAVEAGAECLIPATAVTDIFYVLRKALQSSETARSHIERLSQLVSFADVQAMDIYTALMRDMPDFEDAVADAVAERSGASYIMTRNIRDFAGSVVPAVTPADYLKL